MMAVAVAVAVAAALAAEIGLSLRDRSIDWIAPAVACVVAPGLTLLVVRPEVVFVRYFLVAIAAAYLLVASLLGRMLRGPALARVAAAALVALVTAGQARQLWRFHEHGRGGYLAAMRHVAAETAGGRRATIGSDHNFRNRLVVEYYAAFVPDVELAYVTYPGGGKAAPGWWLVHRFDGQPDPPPILYVGHERYRRSAVFRHGSLSGWTWFVHRRWPIGE
jgi:hypothetical protein